MDRTIGSACDITTGKLDANQAVEGGQYPFFTCAEYPDTIDHYAFDNDVVLVAGNNARGNFHVSRFRGKFNAYQRTYILTAKAGCNIDYVYYALKLELKRLRERSQGSQTKFLTMPLLTGVHLRDLDFDEQSIIADVLSTIDKKIELNNRINTELEAMAKNLYDYWFVQFDFPNANGKPYKTAGGKMVYNTTLKREIPEGWGAATIENIESNIVTGKTPSKKYPEYFGGDVPFITIGDIRGNTFIVDTEENLTKKGADTQKNKYLEKGAICVTCIASPGLVGFVTQKSQTNQQINSVVCEYDYNKYYLYFSIKDFFKFSKAKTGNTFANMNKGDFGGITLINPAEDVLSMYHLKVSSIFEDICNRTIENNQLVKLRDWLLPMLMNGQISVR